MTFNAFEVTILHIAYACIGGFIALFGLTSLFLKEKLYIGEACWAFIFGVIIGPYGFNILDPRSWGGGSIEVTNSLTLEFCRIVLATGVFAIGVDLPKSYVAKHWKSLCFLLFPVATWSWFVSAVLIHAFIPGLSFISSLAVASCLTPTDPVLAATIFGGKWADRHVPVHIRQLLVAASGCYDGAAYPLLYIALYLLLKSHDTGAAIRDWFLIVWLYRVLLGIVIGSLVGFGFRHLLKFCQRHDLIDRHAYVAQYLSLVALTLGITTILGSADLIAAFCCGTAFTWDGFFNRRAEESLFSSVIDLLFNIMAFIFLGAWMPFSSFSDSELGLSIWRLVVIAILVLVLRRLPALVALYRWIPDVKTLGEAVFVGHFGPMGIGAIFVSTLAVEIIREDEQQHGEQVELLSKAIQPIVSFIVLSSVILHGLSIPCFSLGRHVHTISRSWSRHATPDWMNLARLVERGAPDIVVNRDEQMETGEVPSPNEKVEEETQRSFPTGTSDTSEGDDGATETTKEEIGVEVHQLSSLPTNAPHSPALQDPCLEVHDPPPGPQETSHLQFGTPLTRC